MNKKSRILVALIFLLVAGATVLILGLINSNNSNSNPTPTSSATQTPEEQKQEIAGNTATLFMNVVMEGVTEQLGEETASTVQVGSGVAETDTNDVPAKVAILYLTEISNSLDIQKTIDYVKNLLTTVNGNEGTNWVVVQAEADKFEDASVLGAIKAYEESSEPINPSVVEISFNSVPDSDKIEIYVSATVY